MALGTRRSRDNLRDASGSHQGSLGDRIWRGIDLPRPYGTQGSPRGKGGNPGIVRGKEGVKTGVKGTEVETPTTVVSKGSMVRWSIVDRERVRIGLRWKGEG